MVIRDDALEAVAATSRPVATNESIESEAYVMTAEMKPSRTLWAFAISSIALFMVTLDNLVVTTAIPVIRKDLHASLSSLEWTVNAYTLTFAVLLLKIGRAHV